MIRPRKWWLLLALPIAGIVVLAAWFVSGISERNGEYYDSIEDDPRAQPLLRAAEQEAKENLKDHPWNPENPKYRAGQLGFTHVYWKEKKRILREKYGISWWTPAQLNPGTAYD